MIRSTPSRVLVALALHTGLAVMLAAAPVPPVTKKVDHVDEYHGVKVPDPYRWLEDDVRTSTEVAAWVEAQNKVTFGYLESIPARKTIQDRLTKALEL